MTETTLAPLLVCSRTMLFKKNVSVFVW